MRATPTLAALLGVLSLTHAIDLDLNVTDTNATASSIYSAASIIKDDILRIYNANSTGPAIPGLFPSPYYWWEAGLAFDSLINYVTMTGDKSIVATIQDGMLFQVGPNNDYMPPNQTKSEGNDDQATWGLAAMTAVEQNFPPKDGQQVSWLQLAQNVFNSLAARWDTSACDGGLRWQIFTFNAGYSYKNSPSQASFGLLAARLARYTGNATYSDWARKAVEWSQEVGLITEDGNVYDGTDTTTNCSTVNHLQWTNNAGLVIATGAYLAGASTLDSSLRNFTTTFLYPTLSQSFEIFADLDDTKIISEPACQPLNNCNVDQQAFRAPFVRALRVAAELIPMDNPRQPVYNGTWYHDYSVMISEIETANALGAAAQCSGGPNGTTCGTDWDSDTWDGTSGLGQDLAALEAILVALPARWPGTVNDTTATNTTGGGNGATNTGSASVETPMTNDANGVTISMALIVVTLLICALA